MLVDRVTCALPGCIDARMRACVRVRVRVRACVRACVCVCACVRAQQQCGRTREYKGMAESELKELTSQITVGSGPVGHAGVSLLLSTLTSHIQRLNTARSARPAGLKVQRVQGRWVHSLLTARAPRATAAPVCVRVCERVCECARVSETALPLPLSCHPRHW